ACGGAAADTSARRGAVVAVGVVVGPRLGAPTTAARIDVTAGIGGLQLPTPAATLAVAACREFQRSRSRRVQRRGERAVGHPGARLADARGAGLRGPPVGGRRGGAQSERSAGARSW